MFIRNFCNGETIKSVAEFRLCQPYACRIKIKGTSGTSPEMTRGAERFRESIQIKNVFRVQMVSIEYH